MRTRSIRIRNTTCDNTLPCGALLTDGLSCSNRGWTQLLALLSVRLSAHGLASGVVDTGRVGASERVPRREWLLDAQVGAAELLRRQRCGRVLHLSASAVAATTAGAAIPAPAVAAVRRSRPLDAPRRVLPLVPDRLPASGLHPLEHLVPRYLG